MGRYRTILPAFALMLACEDPDLDLGDASPVDASAGKDAAELPEDTGVAADTGVVVADTGTIDSGSVAGPTQIRVEGEADGTALDGESAVCSFWADVGALTFAADGRWSGTVLAGEVFRTITTSTAQNRFEFSAIIAGPATSSRTGDDVAVRVVGDQPLDAKPFWLELEVLTGTTSDDYRASGAWTCAPLDLNEPGFRDVNVEAPGRWRAVPTL